MGKWLRIALLLAIVTLPTRGLGKSASPLVLLEGPSFLLALRYNSEDNFLKKNVYRDFRLDRCWVHPDLAAKLQKLAPLLEAKGLKLVLWDCWRPLAVQRAMWALVPDARYVADPKTGSNHNRGVAVDVSLAKADGTPLEMPTAFDDFSPAAAPKAPCKPEHASPCANRDLLFELMAQVGLKPLPSEWWHFQLPNANRYPIIEALDAKQP
ncbi:M15 family metallopeptidase [bacterium]|nr:MAG: M15 family metallopeptidase [bacterium]